jgi:hypothetical protein
MPIKPQGALGRLFHKGVLARWKSAADAAGTTALTDLRAQRYQARQLRSVLTELCHQADDRLALPRIGSANFVRPAGTDWSWRPSLWRVPLEQPGRAPVLDKTRIGAEIGLFHDCPAMEIVVRQVRNLREKDVSPYSFSMEVFHFDGSYLSLVVDLPTDVCSDLQKRHLIQLSTVIETEHPITILARLNVRHGPNTEQILLTMPQDRPDKVLEFDLAYTQLNEKRAERMWIDLMFQTPGMNRMMLRDLTISRHPRAQI